MTIPIERTNAVLNVERFLMDLRDPKKTRQVSVSNLFGEAMRRVTNEESVSSLFV